MQTSHHCTECQLTDWPIDL